EGYTSYGTHTVKDSDDQGDFTLHVPFGQAVAGAAVTGTDGDLGSGGGSSSATVEYEAMTGMGSLADMGMLDTEVSESVRNSQHLILVGGPAVNTLVSDLAQDNDDVWTQSEWVDQASEGTARVNVVNDAFTSGQHAMVVAGYSASDTRGAARYISNYADVQDDLEGQNMKQLSSADYPTAE
ncbi:MAG: S-layer protein, partial [Candidatus Nanohaloarchaeota archaeon QJJ-7]|nr:S-layer protein [Candidatus Nanohaloarchaeota archaeon QJJ-7]